jgi:hypothetical protein
MATIQQPRIEFTSNLQTGVKVSFQVNFAASEVGGIFPTYIYSARVFFNVIRIVPQPQVAGTPPPPLPAPVTLNITTLSVRLPSAGNITSLSTEFTYTFAVNSNLITDHLHADIKLRRRLRFLPNTNLFNSVIDSKKTNDLVLTVSDLASPQPNGQIIP